MRRTEGVAREALASALVKLRGYGPLSDADEQLLQDAAARTTTLKRGEHIIQQGVSPDESCLLTTGLSGRALVRSNGNRQIVAVNIPGDFIDLNSLFIRPMDHDIIALTDCSVVYFPHKSLRHALSNSWQLTEVLWRNTLVDGAISRKWLAVMAQQNAEEHAAHFICEMYLRLERIGKASNLKFELDLTQNEISDVLGVSNVHMNRTIQVLRALGRVYWTGHTITIRSWDRLVQLAEFDPTYLGWGPDLKPRHV